MLGAPFPAETTLTLCGAAWGKGVFAFWPLWLSATIGNIVGSWITYTLGRKLGRPLILRYGHFVRVTERRFKQAETVFQRYRWGIVVFGKFISGIRLVVPVMAGIDKMSIYGFSAYNAFSASIWSAIYLLEGRYLFQVWHHLHYLVIVAVILLFGIGALVNRWVARRVLHITKNSSQESPKG